MDIQKTIEKQVSVTGIGLHTAHKAQLTFKPAEQDTGIVFIRVDLPEKPVIKVSADYLLPQEANPRRSSLGTHGVHIQTTEHLLAALVGLGIDNLFIEIDNDEVPGLDGSCLNFVEALTKAGIKEQENPRHCFLVKEPIIVAEEGSSIVALPANDYRVSYTLAYDHPAIQSSFLELNINPQTFTRELAPARTFCLEEEAKELQRQGVGLGANYENTLVVGEKGVIRNKLRFQDEFIRHKILDLLGDLYILGQPIKGHIIAIKSGHSLNLKLVKKLIQQRQKYSAVGISSSGPVATDGELDVTEIKKILPHREPFLFVDRIISLEKGKRAVGIKNVTINDYFFKGHFPGKPVMPGVIIIEALAQVGGVMMLSPQENRGKIAYFMAIDNVKFRKPVVPGDQLTLEITAGKIKSRTGQVFGKAYVDGKVVAEADLMFVLEA